MNPSLNYICLAFYILISAAGHICIKIGANHQVDGKLQLLNLKLILGFSLWGISSILWIYILNKLNLNYAIAFASLIYIITPLLSTYFLKEKINLGMVLGFVLIFSGVFVVIFSKHMLQLN